MRLKSEMYNPVLDTEGKMFPILGETAISPCTLPRELDNMGSIDYIVGKMGVMIWVEYSI